MPFINFKFVAFDWKKKNPQGTIENMMELQIDVCYYKKKLIPKVERREL